VDAPESAQLRPERRARPLAGVAMDLALAITIIIPRPFVHTVANRGMGRMAATIALPFVGIKQSAARMMADDFPTLALSCYATLRAYLKTS
jgi:hypothetical protein